MKEFLGKIIRYISCFIVWIPGIFFWGCKNHDSGKKTRVVFQIDHAAGRQVYIETFPYANEEKKILDSAEIRGGKAEVELALPAIEERPLVLTVSNSGVKIVFVNDAPEIIIKGNILRPDEYAIEQSPGMTAYTNFMNEQKKRGATWAPAVEEMKRMKENGTMGKRYDSLYEAYGRFIDTFFIRNKNFADTISSPGVFLYVYNYPDFGKDFMGLKGYINRAKARFPHHSRIQQLHKETMEYLKIFEEDFNPGDILPAIQLPDTSGNYFTSVLTAGKYVFIDFWATWCGPCLEYDAIKIKARSRFPSEKFEIVSIALDPDKDSWRAYVRSKKQYWTQLIDEKVWEGEIRRVYKIDSIPFNFLIGPDRKVLRKAIPPDSVISVISEYLE